MATTRRIELKTAIPGPRSREVLDRLAASVAAPLAITFPIAAAEARGATITDVDGNIFIDFAGGVGCLNVGHSHPQVVAAAQEQLDRFSHTDFTVVPYEVYATLSERLLELAPFSGPAKAAFFNAGTEAVENAVKFARAYTGRPAVIGFEGAFHGRTLPLARPDLEDPSVQGRPRPVRARGLPRAVPERVPRPDGRRGARGAPRAPSRRSSRPRTSPRSCSSRCRARAGSSPRRSSSCRACVEICDEHGIVFVCDEVQSGFARTGRFFAIEHFGVEPDLITVAKSIAMGIPLSGVLGKAEIMDAPAEGGVGGTYVGNPVAQAAALAVLDVIEEEGLVERSAAIGETMRAPHGGLAGALARRSATCAASARCWRSSSSRPTARRRRPSSPPRSSTAPSSAGSCCSRRASHGNCIRVLVPLVISDAELDEALGVWEDALAAAL